MGDDDRSGVEEMPMIEIDRIEPRHDADEAKDQRGTGENLRFNETSWRSLVH